MTKKMKLSNFWFLIILWTFVLLIAGLFIVNSIMDPSIKRNPLEDKLRNSDFIVDKLSLLHTSPDFSYFINTDDCVSEFMDRTEFIGLSKLKSVNCSIISTNIQVSKSPYLTEENIKVSSRCSCDYTIYMMDSN